MIGGKGIFLGNIDGKGAGHVVIIGGGMVGRSAAESFLCLGARITIIEVNDAKREFLQSKFPEITVQSDENLQATLQTADVIIGAGPVKRC